MTGKHTTNFGHEKGATNGFGVVVGSLIWNGNTFVG